MLFYRYLITSAENIFTYNFKDEIELAESLHGEKVYYPLEKFYGHLVDHIFNYDSMYCAQGSYLSGEIDNFRETGSPRELKKNLKLLCELKVLLLNTSEFDELIDEINRQLSFNDYLGRNFDN